MKAAIVIPARYASTRYPGKPLVLLKGATGVAKPLIQRSWEAAMRVRGITRVVVATDDDRIAETAHGFGAEVVMTPESCANGTERCAAALGALDEDIDVIVNLQGDAPLTPPAFVEALLEVTQKEPQIAVATPAIRTTPEVRRRLFSDQMAGKVGGTTVATNKMGEALYFSKSVIPHVPVQRMDEVDLPIFLHVGVYAYQRSALQRYVAVTLAPLEELEGLEQLRFLDYGERVRIVKVLSTSDIWELNNPSDVPFIEAALMQRKIT